MWNCTVLILSLTSLIYLATVYVCWEVENN